LEDARNAYRILIVIHLGRPIWWKDSIKQDFKEVDCENGRYMEPAQDYIQWWALMLVVSNFHVLLLEC
jgi:hypothetical protein